MRNSLDIEADLLTRLANRYYCVVPREYRTHCALGADVAQRALRHYGVHAELLPCQVWCSLPGGRHYVVGFVGHEPAGQKWDGHVVCATEGHIFDTALHHFQREFAVPSPEVAVVRRNQIASQSIAVSTQNSGSSLLWLHPPPSASLRVPRAPEALVEELAAQLIHEVAQVS